MVSAQNPTRAPDPHVLEALRDGMSAARAGDFASARRVAEAALPLASDRATLQGFLGAVCCEMGDLAAGVRYLRAAHDAAPMDIGLTVNLTNALFRRDEPAAALDICTEAACDRDPSLRLWRLRAFLLQHTEAHGGAAQAYRRIVAAQPGDFEAWNNLGNALDAMGDPDGSVDALERAVALDPGVAPTRMNLASALIAAGRLEDALANLERSEHDFPHDPRPPLERSGLLKQLGRDQESLAALERAAALDPNDAALQVQLGGERSLAWDMAGAEVAFRRAIALVPDHTEAHLLLANLLEHTNQEEQFQPLLVSAEASGVGADAVDFIRALAHRRDKRFEEGLETILRVPDHVEPPRRWQLIGQFHDRLGNADEAFDAFGRMNRHMMLDPSDPVRRAGEYRDRLGEDFEALNDAWYRGWPDAAPAAGAPQPVFLVGFPRSGTTLLDTMLMGHPRVEVLEERPPLRLVDEAIGGLDRLAALDAAAVADMRALYYAEAAKHVPITDDTTLVDKFPLHLNKAPLIHRLFPEARIILALRHPCDAVLSCYITNFRLNHAMANFLDIAHVAAVYDLSFGLFERARSIMPLKVHTIRYENVVEDSRAELAPLFEFLDLDWHDGVLDHRETAATRGIISTASYAQVTEPLYKRAAGRWQRYRKHLEPVLPVLAPWAERYGYEI
jgi:tetratricopeptide (TPR) repeat protein